MNVLPAVLGVALLLGVAIDVFFTVLTGRGGGWLTNALTRGPWAALLWVHDRRPIHRALAVAGPLLVLAIVLTWYALGVLGWSLVFYGSDQSIIDSDKFPVVDFPRTVFFVGTTFSTLGYGNLLPHGLPWTVLGNLTALSGTVILTAALSYVFAVLQASVERRQLAAMINTVGQTPARFVERGWAGEDRGAIDDHILSIARQITLHAEKHVNYPILQYFHSDRWQKAPAPAVLVFSDAMFLVRHGLRGDDRPAESLIHLCERSITNYLAQSRLTDGVHTAAGDHDPDTDTIPDALDPAQLRGLGLSTVPRADFEAAYRDYAQRREGLVELAHNDGWTPVVWPPEDAGDADAEPVEVIAKSEGDRPSRRVA